MSFTCRPYCDFCVACSVSLLQYSQSENGAELMIALESGGEEAPLDWGVEN